MPWNADDWVSEFASAWHEIRLTGQELCQTSVHQKGSETEVANLSPIVVVPSMLNFINRVASQGQSVHWGDSWWMRHTLSESQPHAPLRQRARHWALFRRFLQVRPTSVDRRWVLGRKGQVKIDGSSNQRARLPTITSFRNRAKWRNSSAATGPQYHFVQFGHPLSHLIFLTPDLNASNIFRFSGISRKIIPTFGRIDRNGTIGCEPPHPSEYNQ